VIAGLIAAFVLATAVVVVVVRALAAIPVADEYCFEDGCHRPATHEQPVAMAADGTPVVALTCRRHGAFPREYA
jgi:hypothetical protein